MGSLPPLSPELHFPDPKETQTQSAIDETTLLNLFKSQQSHLNFFFQNLDLSQTLSGFVSWKISQTLVSLGVSSDFLSPVDALHGDISILTSRDVLVLFSKYGNTEELVKLVPCAKAKGAFLISVMSVEGNVLAGVCDMNVHLPLERELCPLDLASVTSTVIQMVFGNTVATVLMGARNMTKVQYANHPAGRLGKSLIFKGLGPYSNNIKKAKKLRKWLRRLMTCA
ncbi:hypothetical protein UlMin_040145, partial [Ulmus minor]